MRKSFRIAVLLGICVAISRGAFAQSFVELRQDSTRYNLQSTNGMPISDTAGVPAGSDGRAPGPNPGPLGTANQFQSTTVFGGALVPNSAGLVSGQTLFGNADTLNLPRASAGDGTRVVMLSGRVGSPYLSRSVSFLFGATIPVPDVDEYGVLLKTANTSVTPNRPATDPEQYWLPEPYTPTNHLNRGYYWSPHAKRVFAVSSGPLDLVWRKALPSTPAGSPQNVSTVVIAGTTYTLFSKRYIVSGSAVKSPRQMYWTEGDFIRTGKRVTVPTARVGGLHIVYNNNFPERVATAYPQSSVIEPDPTRRLDEKRTLWFDQSLGSINAYNIEGRAFVELLGDLREDRTARQHLGFEIVDVTREPTPHDVQIDLGERLTTYAGGHPDDSHLFPEPIPNPAQSFAYQHNLNGTDRLEFYAIRETANLNDLQVHWMEEGLAGLKWPFRFVRYSLEWPTDVSKYSHYVRPLVNSETDARATAVPLPNENAPIIQYQDPLDQIRGKLTERFEYYTFLTPAQPAHRGLLRFASGEHIRFERVFSWLDTTLRSGNFGQSVAVNLGSWDSVNGRFNWPDESVTPRVVTATVHVGDRINAPSGELGSISGSDYWAGHIVTETGNSFHPGAYRDPFTQGFEAANLGAIIPVNAIPGDNTLEVLWFRKNQVNLGNNFRNVLWPSAIARYSIQWPSLSSEIILASNDGSGALTSLEARGSIYYQNDSSLPGYNPNEEHALMQGGQAYALRDDLNIIAGQDYSSHPYVLLDYTAADGRPAMRVFKVLREKPEAGIHFVFNTTAGTIMQPPMPLPLLEKPFAPKIVGQPFLSLNDEVSSWIVASSSVATIDGVPMSDLELATRPIFPTHRSFILQDSSGSPRWFFATSIDPDARSVEGVVSRTAAAGIGAWTISAQPADPNRWKYRYPTDSSLPAVNSAVLVAAAEKQLHWRGFVRESGTEAGIQFVVVEFSSARPAEAEDASALVEPLAAPASNAFANWHLSSEPLPMQISNAGTRERYSDFTFKDRKGNQWVYRGPHEISSRPALFAQFYYKTLPGFFFPSLSLANQPAPGVITPYLRARRPNGTFVGDAVHGNANNDQEGDGNPLGITYQPVWPENTPVLEMAETLTLPKRGLPAVRGQSSLEVLYQQSFAQGGLERKSAILHDPTREKEFKLADPSSTVALGTIPDSIARSVYRGKTYFPNLPPHLTERFFFDPNRGENGALVFKGLFVDAPLGDKYLHLNVLGAADTAALKALCQVGDTKKALWENAINGLSTPMELFIENTGRPGTYIPDPSATINVGPSQIAEVTSDDNAVDSYALTAVGPGVGYITLVAGNGRAFTPEADPVSMHIVRIANTLYRGELNIVESSNPLNEKLTLQQVVDLAGRAEDYRFEWLIAAPVDGLPPVVYQNTPRTLLSDGSWSHVRFPLATDFIGSVQAVPAARVAQDVVSSITTLDVINFSSVSNDVNRLHFRVAPPHHLVAGNRVIVRTETGDEIPAIVHAGTAVDKVVVEQENNPPVSINASEVIQLYERAGSDRPESVVYRQFNVPAGTYSQLYLSLNLDGALGAKVYLDGQLVVTANHGDGDTATTSAPSALGPLSRVYLLSPAALAGGTLNSDGSRAHRVAVELDSEAVAGTPQSFNLRIEAFESVDVTAAQWLPIDPTRFEDGVRAVLGGTADVRSLSDNYIVMRYQARNSTHASWQSAPLDSTRNIGWSQWTTPQLAEGWIKRVLKGINPFNQRVTDLFNNQVNLDISVVAQAGARWEGDVALNLDSINDFGLIEIYETVLNRGKMLSIGGGINYGPANDALLLAAGYLNDLYMILGNEAFADAANPTIGIGTKDNTYGDIATALYSFRGQMPSLLEEELALLRGRDDFLLPGVELRPLYNRLPWNYTRGIDAGEVVYALNYNILDQNIDGKVDALDAQKLFPQGHGDSYGHYLTALKGYYALLIDPNFDWVPRIEAVTVLGKPVSVDYQDERKFAAAAAAIARTGKQIFDLTWRRDFKMGPANGWEHFAETRDNSTTRNLTTSRNWGMDHWASRAGQGAYLNWIVGNAILPDHDLDPTHLGSIQQVDRTTVPELKELPMVGQSLQIAMDNAEGSLTPLGLSEDMIAFDLSPRTLIENTHFEQVFTRAKGALNNAIVAFDDAKDVTRLMRSEQDSHQDFRNEVIQQELSYTFALLDLYGSPYPEDIGPGRTFATGYTGPDLIHYMYADTKELNFGSLLNPNQDRVWRIDVQTLSPTWLATNGISTFGFITKARTSFVDGTGNPDTSYLSSTNFFIEYNLDSHGFFQKPGHWTGRRATPGRVQQSISDIIKARNAAYEALYKADLAKRDLDWAISAFERKKASRQKIRDLQRDLLIADRILGAAKIAAEITDKWLELTKDQVSSISQVAAKSIPTVLIAGLAAGGDLTAPARGALEGAGVTFKSVTEVARVVSFSVVQALEYANETAKAAVEYNDIGQEEFNQELRDATSEVRSKVYGVNSELMAINAALQELDDAQRAYRSLVAEGERIQTEREVFRQRSAAIVQGFRTRDAAFRIFRNEKLERYKTMFDLAAQFAFMAAQALDYETGLLHTPQGREFIDRIIRSRALGVSKDGEPQFGGSNTGDPGLSSAMAEMAAEWAVLERRLSLQNPDAYGTVASLRTENFRILPGTEGDPNWANQLQFARKANILDDADVRRYCMQIDAGNGLPLPGIILEFSTTIADGLNLFGRPLAAGDHSFSPAAFATKIFHVGVALEGYKGMHDPNANGNSIGETGASSPPDPSLAFLDPDALAATPYIYVIPVGVDSMRSPPLGDLSVIRTWNVQDVAVPLPFNIGGWEHSATKLYQSLDSLTEPLFALRKHQPFRPVSSVNIYSTLIIYNTSGEIERTQYANTRLFGRSVWNSKWKVIIPGRTLLSDPNEGLDRFVRTVKDVKLYFNTYSYSGN